MANALIPAEVPNWINGQECPARAGGWVEKRNPATGELLSRLARSGAEDVELAVRGAKLAQPAWGATPGAKRGELLYEIVSAMKSRREELARVVGTETGKSLKHAFGEVDAAIQLGFFFAGEGQRSYGRTTTSGAPHRRAMTIRSPLGVAGLIVAANTPIANVAWKVFPALICGNAAILKPPEDAPATAWMFAQICHRAGLEGGLLQVIQGLGTEAGSPLVAHPDIAVVSFTGSTHVGRDIARKVSERVGRVSLELGGKNPFIVCDDADLEVAKKWALLSAFSNAGQRCAAGSRMIVFDSIYEKFRDEFVAAANRLRVGTADSDDFGPLINERQLGGVLESVQKAVITGCRLLCGGQRLSGGSWDGGYYLGPTVLEGAKQDDEITVREIFGPVTCLYRARDFEHAMALANDSPYGLTACIHTKSVHRALKFVEQVQSGVAMVNAGTYGSEPHMPFGGLKLSGNGTREPGTEALDVYSSLKDVYLSFDPDQL